MSFEDLRHGLGIAVLVCVFGVFLNLLMLKKRGKSAALLAGAFLSLGASLFLASRDYAWPLIAPFGLIVLILLGLDVILRLKQMGGQG